MKVMHVVGARPNFMKASPIIVEMSLRPNRFDQVLVHTGQHYDDNMSTVFFEDLDLPRPDVFLGVGSGSHAQQTARIMSAFERVLLEQRPDMLVVYGDVNSTIACALTAAKLGFPVAHVEAGLRSFDRTMPEEINRILTDHLADLLFTTERSGNNNLSKEGIPTEKVHFVGNTMIDTLVTMLPRAMERWVGLCGKLGIGEEKYILVTLHRPSNVDDPAALKEIVLALGDLAKDVSVIFPVHPRTRPQIASCLPANTSGRLCLLEPLGYLDFLALTANAAVVLTDSGGIQEETTYLKVPCITVRPNTERPVTLDIGTNRLISGERANLVNAARQALNHTEKKAYERPELWDGHAARRLVDVLESWA